ncbi:site-specfic recombinase, phage integrase family protein [Oceanicola granulosus HTCC2516]|uniref:Site-specfic recombinase, phage integrase family protein n=1 Tax=Oceanicola granulosus (strain ATCC BAA-861 / DSM 15982 / KCTC 12143 / HTCC2516) TaxID=314256 RepID=Q2CEG0_OCEGH|nr:site-specfic recombinase, phage integrase family protein [Oceanicola granulosus HTCC2516]
MRTVAAPGKYFDGHGLFLKVEASGAKRWVQRITIRGKRRELGLGAVALMSLAEAREVALVNRRNARAGGDPLRDKQESRAVLTFEEAARKVHELHRPTWRNAKHAAQFITTLETYAFPRIGRMSVADVSTADVLSVLAPIWLDKPETARRVRQRIGTVMKWAVAQGWRQDNPAQTISSALPRQDKRQEHRKSLPYDELPAFLTALRRSKASDLTKLALELVILTASRSGEVRLARWEEVDLEKAAWTIPAERMKAGRQHRVPLSPRAIEILHEAKALGALMGDTSGHVFPGARSGKPLSDMTLTKLVRGMGYDIHVHGFRTTFKVWAQERTNFPREVTEAALAHTIRNKAEAAYARSDLFDKRRQLMKAWAVEATANR